MNTVFGKLENGTLTISLSGSIDSANAPQIEAEIARLRQDNPAEAIALDIESLEYTTSAGLRVILRLLQDFPNTRIINASPQMYQILETTGFTEMMEVQRAYRVVSVEGCEVIGQGANGKVYRIDMDTIVKVYHNPDALPEIQHERELARTAFVAGVPTAIPYDVVRIEGGGYGSVFELLNATSFAKLLIRGEKTVDEVAAMSIDLLKLIHSKTVKPEDMADMRAVALNWVDFLKDYLPAELFDKLNALVTAVPRDMHMMHGDFHIRNVMLQGDEVLLVDMDTLSYGHPIFELASMYNAYCGYGAVDHACIENFLGISYETAGEFWRRSLALYLGTEDEETLRRVEDAAKIIGFTRIMRREIRRNGLNTEKGQAVINNCGKVLAELLPRVDSLSII